MPCGFDRGEQCRKILGAATQQRQAVAVDDSAAMAQQRCADSAAWSDICDHGRQSAPRRIRPRSRRRRCDRDGTPAARPGEAARRAAETPLKTSVSPSRAVSTSSARLLPVVEVAGDDERRAVGRSPPDSRRVPSSAGCASGRTPEVNADAMHRRAVGQRDLAMQ